MRKSKRLQRLARLSETAERVAAAAWSKSQAELSQCEAQLNQLIEYRSSYQQGLASGTAEPMSGEQARELRKFIAQVDLAIKAMASKREVSTRACELAQEKRTGHMQRKNAVQDIAGRERVMEENKDEAYLQREIDDSPRRKI